MYPQARLVTLVACGTRALLDAAVGPLRGSGAGERALARQVLPSLRPGMLLLADRGFLYKGKNIPESQKAANCAHARLRSPGERANAQLKIWRILRKLRCCLWRTGQLAKASYPRVADPRYKRRMKRFNVVGSHLP